MGISERLADHRAKLAAIEAEQTHCRTEARKQLAQEKVDSQASSERIKEEHITRHLAESAEWLSMSRSERRREEHAQREWDAMLQWQAARAEAVKRWSAMSQAERDFMLWEQLAMLNATMTSADTQLTDVALISIYDALTFG